jgi:hypothetical protein
MIAEDFEKVLLAASNIGNKEECLERARDAVVNLILKHEDEFQEIIKQLELEDIENICLDMAEEGKINFGMNEEGEAVFWVDKEDDE